ncbi:MAG: hypothetical protein IJZ87_06010 [Bacteroidales bacterium]|nr:hypothetical protein [Bacteroidales bacterium]
MKRTLKLLLGIFVLSIMVSSCEKGCMCRNLDNGASNELYGVYSQKDCEAYTDYYKTVYHADNVECSMEWRK